MVGDPGLAALGLAWDVKPVPARRESGDGRRRERPARGHRRIGDLRPRGGPLPGAAAPGDALRERVAARRPRPHPRRRDRRPADARGHRLHRLQPPDVPALRPPARRSWASGAARATCPSACAAGAAASSTRAAGPRASSPRRDARSIRRTCACSPTSRASTATPGRSSPARGEARDLSLGDFLDRGRYSTGFVRHFLLPMGGAVWSAPFAEMRRFPARSFLRFFENHGWLSLTGAPQWWTVEGGSRDLRRRDRAPAPQATSSLHARGSGAARPRRRDRVLPRARVAIRSHRDRDPRRPGPAPARRSLRGRAPPPRRRSATRATARSSTPTARRSPARATPGPRGTRTSWTAATRRRPSRSPIT